MPVLKDPPGAVFAETDRLVFHVSPLSNKGLLSQQVRDALKALLRDTHGATIVKLRAFVAPGRIFTRPRYVLFEWPAEMPLEMIVELVFLPIWIIFVPVSAC